jgi:hypothetical protein
LFEQSNKTVVIFSAFFVLRLLEGYWHLLALFLRKSELLMLTNVCPGFTFVYIEHILWLHGPSFLTSIGAVCFDFPLAPTNGLAHVQKRHLTACNCRRIQTSFLSSPLQDVKIKGNEISVIIFSWFSV